MITPTKPFINFDFLYRSELASEKFASEPVTTLTADRFAFLNNTISDFFNHSEEFFVIILFFSFLNLIFSLLFLELLWPTHFFNLRHSSEFKKFRMKDFNVSLLKKFKFN